MNLESFILELKRITQECGDYLLEVQDTVKPWEKGDLGPVSEADIETEKKLKVALTTLLPDSEFRGEELGWSTWEKEKYCWIVDPLDGTKPYLAGVPHWGISIALIKDNEPVLGVFYFPVFKEFIHAVKGKGTFLNGKRLAVSSQSEPRLAVNEQTRPEVEAKGLLIGEETHCSISKTTAVLKQEAEAYYNNGKTNTSIWDIAAAIILVEEAGGRASDLTGERITLNVTNPRIPAIILSNKVTHEKLLKVL